MITLVDVKTDDHGGSGWTISGRLDRRRPNGRFRRTALLRPSGGLPVYVDVEVFGPGAARAAFHSMISVGATGMARLTL
ncbi:MAG TPA: hypothetical protein VJX94_19505 [Stellaceae bacterium]|nr:hypothetical protein [Stellaceae bacterium]